MKPRAGRARSTVSEIRKVRGSATGRLGEFPNVVGSMIGRKTTGGKMSGELCLTILVSEKLPSSRLAARQRIPKAIRVGSKSITLDVVSCREMHLHGGMFPPGPLLTYDAVETGTVACLCRSPYGVFGMSCAHAIDGPDGNISSPDLIQIWSRPVGAYQPVGESCLGIRSPGMGMHGEFGFIDVGLFTLRNPELAAAAMRLRPVPSRPPFPGMQLFGQSGGGPRIGRIVGIEVQYANILADVFIEVEPPGMVRGDSGMLWRSRDQFPIAIHTMGEPAPPGQGSRLTAAMLSLRAERHLAVQLLEPA